MAATDPPEAMEQGIAELIYLGILMASGFVVGDFLEKVGIPRVAGYVAVGALWSESLLGGAVAGEPGVWSDSLTNLLLAVIAFMVGAEIDLGRLRREETQLAAVTAGQSLGAVLAVTIALAGLPMLFPGMFRHDLGWATALVFGVIATATAPAASLAVVEEYEAAGSMTSLLLGIIAVDDAVAIILFTLAIGLVGEASVAEQVLGAGQEILFSVTAGTAFGVALGLFGRHVASGDLRLPLILGVVVLNFGLAALLEYSDLLSSIVLGLVALLVFNRSQREWLEPMEHFRETAFLIFFTLSGTHFDPAVFTGALPLIVAYIVARVVGKYLGARSSARLAGGDRTVQRYLGLALLPQAGVAIGLALRASGSAGIEQTGVLLLNTMIGSTIIFELSAPWLTKLSLERAGEIEG